MLSLVNNSQCDPSHYSQNHYEPYEVLNIFRIVQTFLFLEKHLSTLKKKLAAFADTVKNTRANIPMIC